MSHYHAVVWLDHNEARVMHISPDDVEKSVVHPASPARHLQRKRGSVSGSRQPEDQHYYHEVAEALAGAQEILVVGPGHAKLELIKHIHAHDHGVADKVIGVEVRTYLSGACSDQPSRLRRCNSVSVLVD